MNKKLIAAVVILAVVLVAGFTAYFYLMPPSACMPLGGTKVLKSRVSATTFDAITEYSLPSPSRWSNGITVAQDGSVWFGEQSVPGVGHLFANGTLVEYPWPSAAHPASKTCGFQTSIWGVAVWNGMVWGTDGDGNTIVGINPQSGATRVINVTGLAPFPYTLSVGPDNALWFTSLGKAAVLGRIGQDYTASALRVLNVGAEYPAQLEFLNSTLAYMVTLDTAKGSGGVYTFNPSASLGSIDPQQVDGNFQLQFPDSLSVGGGTILVTEHGPAHLAAFNMSSGQWTLFPATPIVQNITTLPYFDAYGSGGFWFNEHYGNRIGFLNIAGKTMTEYSEANPPVTNETNIGNDLTIAPSSEGLWFTSTTGNYIGFANASYVPEFSISGKGATSATVQPGGQARFNFTVNGSWKSTLSVLGSDSEGYTGAPLQVAMAPSPGRIQPGSGPVQLQVQVTASSKLAPGDYTLGVTVSDGLVLRTAFVFLVVS
jgi:hypothetical protein